MIKVVYRTNEGEWNRDRIPPLVGIPVFVMVLVTFLLLGTHTRTVHDTLVENFNSSSELHAKSSPVTGCATKPPLGPELRDWHI